MRKGYPQCSILRYYYGEMSHQSSNKAVTIALMALGAVLLVLLVALWHIYVALRRADVINRQALSFSAFTEKRAPLSASSVGTIRVWMTFGYLNKAFGLPQNYFKDQLHITDVRYPNLTLGNYASENGLAPSVALQHVQDATAYYFKTPHS